MVVILRPTSEPMGEMHERRASPSTWTVQAPHWAMPHPNLVPVRPSTSRSAHSRGMLGSASTWRSAPLMLRLTILLTSVIRTSGSSR